MRGLDEAAQLSKARWDAIAEKVTRNRATLAVSKLSLPSTSGSRGLLIGAGVVAAVGAIGALVAFNSKAKPERPWIERVGETRGETMQMQR